MMTVHVGMLHLKELSATCCSWNLTSVRAASSSPGSACRWTRKSSLFLTTIGRSGCSTWPGCDWLDSHEATDRSVSGRASASDWPLTASIHTPSIHYDLSYCSKISHRSSSILYNDINENTLNLIVDIKVTFADRIWLFICSNHQFFVSLHILIGSIYQLILLIYVKSQNFY